MMNKAIGLLILAVSLFMLDVVATNYSTNYAAVEPDFAAPIINLLADILPLYR